MVTAAPPPDRSRSIYKERVVFRGIMDKIIVQERNVQRSDDEDEGGKDTDVLKLGRVRILEPKLQHTPDIKPTRENIAGNKSHKTESRRRSTKSFDRYTSLGVSKGDAGRPESRGRQGAQIDFDVPTTRGSRPTTDDGRTSFHLSHESISKTRKEVGCNEGLKNRPGAAGAHTRYIERETAVAVIDGPAKTPQQLEVERLACAEEQGVSVTNDRADVAFAAEEPANVRFTGEPFTAVISRHAIAIREALAAKFAPRRTAGSLASVPLLSSIPVLSHDAETPVPVWSTEAARLERQGVAGNGMQWERGSSGEMLVSRGGQNTVEDAVGKPEKGSASEFETYIERQQAIALMGDGSIALFTNIPGDAEDRAKVWDVIEEFEDDPGSDLIRVNLNLDPDFWVRIASDLDCPKDLRDAIAAGDPTITDPEKIKPFKVEDEAAIRNWVTTQDGWNSDQPQGKFSAARGGRIQYRIIGELPHEISSAERASILKEYVQIFEKKRLPYVAVIHAPDYTNDARNWHFHIVYYDRPINKMPDGQWDFAVAETYKDDQRHTRIRYPHRQNKVREVNLKRWVPMLRKRLADITNDHLKRANIKRQLDPRKYSEMGIDRAPQEHLGTRLSALEASGVTTAVGAANERKEWDAEMRLALKRRDDTDRETDAQRGKWADRVTLVITDPIEAADLQAQIRDWSESQKDSAEYRLMSDMIQRLHDRSISRAERVIETSRKKISAIDADKTSGYEKRQRAAIARDEKAAIEHIRRRQAFLAEDLRTAQRWGEESVALQITADRLAKRIAYKLSPMAAMRPSPDYARLTEEYRTRTSNVVVQMTGEEAGRGPQDRDDRRLLSPTEIDAFVEKVTHEKRRIEHRDQKHRPVVLAPGEAEIINALNYQAISLRLAGLKNAQDGLIKEVAAFIQANQSAISSKIGASGREEFLLTTDRKSLQTAFTLYGNEPVILTAARNAKHENNIKKFLADLAEGYTPPTTLATTIARADVPARAQPPAAAVKKPSSQRDINPHLEAIASAPGRIVVVGASVKVDDDVLKTLGLAEGDLNGQDAQRRLKGILAAQERDFRRLEEYIRSRPDLVTERNGKIVLSHKAPDELLDIASKWSDDTQLQASLRKIAEAARTGVAEDKDRTKRQIGGTAAEGSDDVPAAGVGAVPVAPRQSVEGAEIATAKTPADMAKRAQRELLASEVAELSSLRAVEPDNTARGLEGKAAPVRGVHPKIDAWREADEAKENARFKLAALAVADREANRVLQSIDVRMADRVRRDAAIFRQREQQARQAQLGLFRDS